jgi:hypothetical protein
MTKYDPSILQTFADTLYNKASFITFQYAVVFLPLG